MLTILLNRTYCQLFAAQVIALLGTGLLTVALGLLAYDLAGEEAGAVLGTALAIKMVAYVGLAPVANALAERLPRKAVLIGADLLRASVALFLPFIDAVWQIYVLIFVLQAASATFTPAFQATIPDILPDEREYTKALSLSRLAYDLENLISPALAGFLLLVMSYHWLFAGTVIGFLCSAMLVCLTAIPMRAHGTVRPFIDRLTRGVRIYLATPRLRGLLALNMTASAAGAFVIVNTVVLVRTAHSGSESDVAVALAAFGAGSMTAALGLPWLLDRIQDRTVMTMAGALLAGLTIGHSIGWLVFTLPGWFLLLTLWTINGLLYSVILTPSGRLLRRSSHDEDRASVFAAQFALSHACWLIAYPVAGWVGESFGLPLALLSLGFLGVGGVMAALCVWPVEDTEVLAHEHPDLPSDHPHLQAHANNGQHRHVFVVDDWHRKWPQPSEL